MGMVKDMEKYNSVTSSGWSILRLTPPATWEESSRFGTAKCINLIAKVLKQKEGAIPLFLIISCNRDSYRFTGAADGTRLRERCCVPYRRLPTGGPKRLDNP